MIKLLGVLSEAYTQRLSGFGRKAEPRRFAAKGAMVEMADTAPPAIVPQFAVQKPLRLLYGKGDPIPPSIGDHPDFVNLKGSRQVENCAITTMFMDIESSTRLGLLYEPYDVYVIKNAFIQIAIEIVKAFDGHVHRIMGDAVMAYFGGKRVPPQRGTIDGLNCAAVLNIFTKLVVVPKLKQMGYPDDFGIRLGLDYGPAEKVIWAHYGYAGVGEVTATSFFVDVAAKLQHAAGKNQIMLGQSICEFLDFPEELLEKQTTRSGGQDKEQPYLQPNHTDQQGRPVNYKQFLLKTEEYLQCSPLIYVDTSRMLVSYATPDIAQVSATLWAEKGGQPVGDYYPTCTIAPKDNWILFKVRLPANFVLPYEARFIVENHGNDALNKVGTIRGSHDTTIKVGTPSGHSDLKQWERTLYRGLHYMTVEIKARGKILARTVFGVYVE